MNFISYILETGYYSLTHLSLTSPLYVPFTWLTLPGPFRTTTCRERELTQNHIILFWLHKDMKGLPEWGINSVSGPPPRQHNYERWYTSSTHPFILTRRIWKDYYDGQMIFGDLVGLKLPDICLTGEEKPRTNIIQETCPDRGSNPGLLRGRRACYRLLYSGGLLWFNTRIFLFMISVIYNPWKSKH